MMFRAGGYSHGDGESSVGVRHSHGSSELVLNGLDQLVLLLSETWHAAPTVQDDEQQWSFGCMHFTNQSADASLISDVSAGFCHHRSWSIWLNEAVLKRAFIDSGNWQNVLQLQIVKFQLGY